jgi:4-amino-4-deoxy-L-arabinose transferase-like glycosyltransferase
MAEVSSVAVASAPSPPGSASTGRRREVVLLVLVGLVAALCYAWRLQRDPLEPYYAAAVRSMAGSWHDFAFGAFDPDGTISLDKLPGAFWIQALSVRAFGVHTWSIVLPQIVEGVLAVLVLHRAVRRLAGPGAGLVAALVLALSPAVVALDRGNISDSLMILLLLLAADAVTGAVTGAIRGTRVWPILVAGIWVGLAFQAKMLEAWLVLPALALCYLVAGPAGVGRRVRHMLVGGAVTAVVSLLWMVVVGFVPAASRPYVDGSTHDSLFEQVFVYNGLGRVGQASPLQILTGQGLSLVSTAGPPGVGRLLTGDLGHDIGWLLPLALLAAVAGVISARGRPRIDPLRAGYLLWGGWLVVFVVAFSTISTVNSYYTAVLAAPIAAIMGIGLADVWHRRESALPRVLAAIGVAGTALYAGSLTAGPTLGAPRGLGLLLGVLALVAVALLVVSAFRTSRAVLPRAGLAVGVVAVLLVPTLGTVEIAARGAGAFDTPFESRAEAIGTYKLFVAVPALIQRTLPGLQRARRGAPDLLAVQSAAVASVFSYPSGQEVLPIGGFTGTGPTPTLAQLRDDVARARFHLVLTFPSRDPRVEWIAQHCPVLGLSTPPLRDYYCTPPDAEAGP